MKIIIAGGGIGGLTLALAAKTAGYSPIVIENRPNVGGIGLWQPSQIMFQNQAILRELKQVSRVTDAQSKKISGKVKLLNGQFLSANILLYPNSQVVLQNLGILGKLQQVSEVMPHSSYFDHKGHRLGEPSEAFNQRTRILCIGRQKLSRVLSQQCFSKGIQIRTGLRVTDAESTKHAVKVQLSNGQFLSATALIGADGIHSNVRNIIMRERKRPEVKAANCGYAYFRAVIDLSKEKDYKPQNSDFHDYAFESWGEGKRFGYVPLKAPETFWFLTIPINKYGLKEQWGSHTCSEEQKNWILSLFEHWKAPLSIKKLIQLTPAQTIIRTDLRKINGVTQFPWNTSSNRILILGDAANATAPNLAQGAGLAIQSAWDLISMVNLKNGDGVQEFMSKRRRRAENVQYLADLISKFGQIDKPYSNIRNFFMYSATKYMSILQKLIFEMTVRYLLGGTSSTPHWLAPYSPHEGFIKTQSQSNSLLLKIIKRKQFQKLSQVTGKFRLQLIGEGKGKVTVQSAWFGRFFGLPSNMQNADFGAYIDTSFDKTTDQVIQKWSRVFGQGSNGAVLYSTNHRSVPDFYSQTPSGLTLTESLGSNFVLDMLRFGYDVKIIQNGISYRSIGLWLWSYKLPIPRFLLPSSAWIEEQTQTGWKFDGSIALPKFLGGFPFFKYRGNFVPKLNEQFKAKRVVIAGGSGFIGRQVARHFYKKGWYVTILSRKATPISGLPFAKVQKWNPSNKSNFKKQAESLYDILKDKHVLINLAGENPSALRWNASKKAKILDSRLDTIKLLSQAIKITNNPDLAYLQISAGGIYGSRGDQVLTQDSKEGTEHTFRIDCLKQIQKVTKEQAHNSIVLRMGHVLGAGEGLFPFLQLSSFFRVKRFGSGGQYIPWIHVEDVAAAMLFVASQPQKFKGKVVNIASPQHHTYDSFYKTMGEVHSRRPLIPIPQFLMKWSLGEMSSVILDSQRIDPKILVANGFKFEHSSLHQTLASKALL